MDEREDMLDEHEDMLDERETVCVLVCVQICVPLFSHMILTFFFSPPDRVAEGEFIKGVLENEVALRLIQYQPLK